MLNVLKLTISLYLGGIVVSDVVSSLLLLLAGEFDIEIVLGIMGVVAFLGLFHCSCWCHQISLGW